MIKLLLIMGLAGLAGLVMIDNPLNHRQAINESITPAVLQAGTGLPGKTVETEAGKFAYSLIAVEEGESLKLIPNYKDRVSSARLMSENGCKKGVNGGFYSEDFQPIGGVKSQGTEIGKYRPNRLFNGYVGVDGEGSVNAGLGWDPALIEAVQSGPVVIASGREEELALERDKNARRMAAMTGSGTAYFLTVYDPETILDGPKLSSLGAVVKAVAEREGIEVGWAVNLDGGAASAWYSPTLTLTEWQPVGSFWCLK